MIMRLDRKFKSQIYLKVVGRLLFILYINDLLTQLSSENANSHTDTTTVSQPMILRQKKKTKRMTREKLPLRLQ